LLLFFFFCSTLLTSFAASSDIKPYTENRIVAILDFLMHDHRRRAAPATTRNSCCVRKRHPSQDKG
jgi:hypothetical protein